MCLSLWFGNCSPTGCLNKGNLLFNFSAHYTPDLKRHYLLWSGGQNGQTEVLATFHCSGEPWESKLEHRITCLWMQADECLWCVSWKCNYASPFSKSNWSIHPCNIFLHERAVCGFYTLLMLKPVFCAHTLFKKKDGGFHQLSMPGSLADSLFLRRLAYLMQTLQLMLFTLLLSGNSPSWYIAYWFWAVLDWIYGFLVLSHINTKCIKGKVQGRVYDRLKVIHNFGTR